MKPWHFGLVIALVLIGLGAAAFFHWGGKTLDFGTYSASGAPKSASGDSAHQSLGEYISGEQDKGAYGV